MPGQNSKCSSCDKPKETAVIECSFCEQWFPYCCAGVSASDDVVEFEFVPFYCSQCLSTNRLVALKTQPNVTIVIAKQAQGGRRQSKCSQCNRPIHLSCVKISRKHAKAPDSIHWQLLGCRLHQDSAPIHLKAKTKVIDSITENLELI